MQNKRAQLSDVMSWVVATLVVIGILVIFVYASMLLAQKTKIVNLKNIEIDLGSDTKEDWLETKTSIAYETASDSQKEIIDSYFLRGEDNGE